VCRLMILTTVLVVLLVSGSASAADDLSTKEMARFCRINGEINDKAASKPDANELLYSGMCIGYVKGYRDAVDGQRIFAAGGLVHCIPREATNGQLGEIYATWAKANPEELHHSAAFGFAQAMAKAFPCER